MPDLFHLYGLVDDEDTSPMQESVPAMTNNNSQQVIPPFDIAAEMEQEKNQGCGLFEGNHVDSKKCVEPNLRKGEGESTSPSNKIGLFEGEVSAPKRKRAGNWKSTSTRLPDFWWIDLAMIIITIVGVGMIAYNWSIILWKVAMIIASLASNVLMLAIVVGIVIVAGRMLRRRWRW